VEFAGRWDIPAIVQAAIVHAQFETIHPFVDGNGRTGRVLIQSLLQERGLITSTTIPISAGLLVDTKNYFRALTEYRDGNIDSITAALSQATLTAISNGRILADDIVAIREKWRDQITVRSDSSAWRLADLLISQPVITAAHVASELELSDRGARNALDALVRYGVLSPAKASGRLQCWQATDVLTAMDAFARRAGRRR
jgi:Fic family protein